MEVSDGAQEGFVREWAPCSHILNLIPPRIQTGIFSNELMLTCVDAVNEYIALGTNVGLVYWYDRKKGNIQKLRCEVANSPITYVKIVSTVDYMVGAGNAAGQVTVFQIPKEHPENVPDTFKPKVEPKVERYTIGDLHKGKITAIEWSKNGMRLFSGDNNGIIIMTEIDFYMHLCKSMEIVNEQHEIVQISYYQNTLVVSSMYRSIVCERRAGADGRTSWHVTQLGKRDRKRLCAAGAVVRHSYASGSAEALYCARPGLRLWRADRSGEVLQTLIFKEAVSNPLTVAELLNPTQQRHSLSDHELGPLYVFREHFLVSHDDRLLYILDPRSLTAVAVVDQLRSVTVPCWRLLQELSQLENESHLVPLPEEDMELWRENVILSVSVNKDEIFILEGPRSLVRLAHAPEPATLATEQPSNLMTKSLTTSIQQAVNTVRDLTHIEHTVPYIASVLEQPIAMFTKHDTNDSTCGVASAEECFELPPIKRLPNDISENVLESIVNEFRDVTDAEEVRRARAEELQRKLKLYNSIMERKWDEELIHSRRSRRREVTGPGSSGGSTPRRPTPVRRDVSYTNSCVMNVSVYGNIEQPHDDELLEKQIEEKEKILAKLLNLESLSIAVPQQETENTDEILTREIEIKPAINDTDIPKPVINDIDKPKPVITVKKEHKPVVDLVPKLMKLPNNWNLEGIELKLDMRNGFIDHVISPDDNLDSEWEII